MNLKRVTIILLLCMTLLAIPIVWLTHQAGEAVTFLVPIVILVNFVIANIIIHKTSYNPYQDSRFYAFKKMERTFASGVVALFVLGIITKPLISSLPNRWVFLIIFFVIGVLVGDILQRAL